MTHVILDGIKFNKDSDSGYYLSSKDVGKHRIRLHRYVWEKYNGSIPKGYQVHHIDHNKDNNDISNLKLMTEHDHLVLEHEYHEKLSKEWMEKFHARGIAAAPKWHKSEEGKKWHTQNYQSVKDIWMSKVTKKCAVCGKEYTTTHAKRNTSRFCSNNCKSKWRRDHHLDDEVRRCVICGKEFTTNKYRKKQTCSRECKARLQSKTKLSKSRIN